MASIYIAESPTRPNQPRPCSDLFEDDFDREDKWKLLSLLFRGVGWGYRKRRTRQKKRRRRRVRSSHLYPDGIKGEDGGEDKWGSISNSSEWSDENENGGEDKGGYEDEGEGKHEDEYVDEDEGEEEDENEDGDEDDDNSSYDTSTDEFREHNAPRKAVENYRKVILPLGKGPTESYNLEDSSRSPASTGMVSPKSEKAIGAQKGSYTEKSAPRNSQASTISNTAIFADAQNEYNKPRKLRKPRKSEATTKISAQGRHYNDNPSSSDDDGRFVQSYHGELNESDRRKGTTNSKQRANLRETILPQTERSRSLNSDSSGENDIQAPQDTKSKKLIDPSKDSATSKVTSTRIRPPERNTTKRISGDIDGDAKETADTQRLRSGQQKGSFPDQTGSSNADRSLKTTTQSNTKEFGGHQDESFTGSEPPRTRRPGVRETGTKDYRDRKMSHDASSSTEPDAKSSSPRKGQPDTSDTLSGSKDILRDSPDTTTSSAAGKKQPKSGSASREKMQTTDKADSHQAGKRNVSDRYKSEQDNQGEPDRPITGHSKSSSKASGPGHGGNRANDDNDYDDETDPRKFLHAEAETGAEGNTKSDNSATPQALFFSSIYETVLKGPLTECLAKRLSAKPDLVTEFFRLAPDIQQNIYIEAANRSSQKMEKFVEDLGDRLE